MHVLSNNSGQSSNGILHCKGSDAGEDDVRDYGSRDDWNFSFDQKLSNRKEISDQEIIRIVNDTFPLYVVLRDYNIQFERQYSPTGWTHRCACPFKDHNDTAPSFGYNSKEDRFNCFGCNRHGRTVQFLAYIRGVSVVSVARELYFNDIVYNDNLNVSDDNLIDYGKLDDLLFDYANYVREFKSRHGNDIYVVKYADAVTWNLDVYLRKHAMRCSIVLDDLVVRINKLKEQIDAYEG